MIYQLPNGKCIEMSLEQFLELSDQDITELVALSAIYTLEVNNPFFKPFSKKTKRRDPELDHEIEPTLDKVDKDEKLNDKDFFRDDN
tara:strand:+ start:616 stop:876 length:261 start_codon:yes stop_codon:yes gene_type:complete